MFRVQPFKRTYLREKAAAVSKRFGDGGVIYVATDSRGDEADFLDSIDESVKIVSLRNFITDISRVDPKFYGMIDQVVASRSEVFLGTYFSSFTNGINRLRGCNRGLRIS